MNANQYSLCFVCFVFIIIIVSAVPSTSDTSFALTTEKDDMRGIVSMCSHMTFYDTFFCF